MFVFMFGIKKDSIMSVTVDEATMKRLLQPVSILPEISIERLEAIRSSIWKSQGNTIDATPEELSSIRVFWKKYCPPHFTLFDAVTKLISAT